MVLAGGTPSRKLDLDAFVRQASAYEEWEPGWDKLARLRIELGQTHAFPVKRVSELMSWVRSRRLRPDRRRRVRPPRRPGDARAEAGDAVEYYAERFRAIFREAGAGVEKAGDQVADAAEKLSDWLRAVAAMTRSARAEAAAARDAAAGDRDAVAAGHRRADDRRERAVARRRSACAARAPSGGRRGARTATVTRGLGRAHRARRRAARAPARPRRRRA